MAHDTSDFIATIATLVGATAALIAANMLVWSNNKYDAALGRFNVISIGQKDGDAPYNTKREALEAIEEMQRIVNANT